MLGAQVKRSGSRLVQFPREWSLEKRKKKREEKRKKRRGMHPLQEEEGEREDRSFLSFFFSSNFLISTRSHTCACRRVSRISPEGRKSARSLIYRRPGTVVIALAV